MVQDIRLVGHLITIGGVAVPGVVLTFTLPVDYTSDHTVEVDVGLHADSAMELASSLSSIAQRIKGTMS